MVALGKLEIKINEKCEKESFVSQELRVWVQDLVESFIVLIGLGYAVFLESNISPLRIVR